MPCATRTTEAKRRLVSGVRSRHVWGQVVTINFMFPLGVSSKVDSYDLTPGVSWRQVKLRDSRFRGSDVTPDTSVRTRDP